MVYRLCIINIDRKLDTRNFSGQCRVSMHRQRHQARGMAVATSPGDDATVGLPDGSRHGARFA
jgi:hypothetical protein